MPVSIVALRGLTNERGDFIITTLPIIDMSVAPLNTTQVLADFADGGGWTTQVCPVNPSATAMTGKVQFVSSAGVPLNTVAYSIAGASSTRVATPGTAASTQSGYVLVIPDSGSSAPSALAIFSLVQAGVTVTEAGVQPTTGSALRDLRGDLGNISEYRLDPIGTGDRQHVSQ